MRYRKDFVSCLFLVLACFCWRFCCLLKSVQVIPWCILVLHWKQLCISTSLSGAASDHLTSHIVTCKHSRRLVSGCLSIAPLTSSCCHQGSGASDRCSLEWMPRFVSSTGPMLKRTTCLQLVQVQGPLPSITSCTRKLAALSTSTASQTRCRLRGQALEASKLNKRTSS